MRTRNPRQARTPTDALDGGILKAYDRPCVPSREKLAGCQTECNPRLLADLSTTSPEAVHGSDAPTDVELWAAVLAEENAENSRIY